MREGWKKVSLNEIGSVGRGKSRHRPRNAEFLYNGAYPFIQTGDIEAARFYINSYSQTYNEFGLAQSKLWPKGTLCISIVGANTGASAILDFDACFPDSVICFTPNSKKSDVKFIKYALEFMRYELKSISQGAARENLSLEKLMSIKFLVPEILLQKKIVSIINSYDDLIDNNLKRIKLLEEKALLTYEEWFVKMCFPGYETAKFDKVTGLPEGWKSKKLTDIYEIKYGKNLPQTKIKNKGKYKVYGASGIMGYFDESNCFEKAVLVTSRGNGSGEVHRTYENESFITNNSFVVIPKNNLKCFSISYTYGFFKYLDLTRFCSGSAQPQLTNASMVNIDIKLPSQKLLFLFSDFTNKIVEASDKLREQNLLLKEARDILLPRLMSGMIDVEELELESSKK